MPTDIVLPNLGFDAQSGRLIEWLKQVGDSIEKGEAIAIIESDKAEVEFESIAAGTIVELCVAEDEDVPIGSVIARLSQGGETPAPISATPPVEPKELSVPTPKEQFTPPSSDGQVMALPKVRRAARRADISLAEMLGAGYVNPLTLDDLNRFQRMRADEPAASLIEQSALQKRTAERMRRSMREAPHFYLSGEFDLEGALESVGPEVRPNDLLQYLVLQTLRQVPQLNARHIDGQLYQYNDIHLAMAIALDQGLIAPVIRQAQLLSLEALAERNRDLIQRARNAQLAPAELQGGTFTVSNLGMVKQVDQFTAVINPPQIAIAAIGAIKKRPLVINEGLHLRRTVWITLSGDHRFVDGMALARFLGAFQTQLDQLQD